MHSMLLWSIYFIRSVQHIVYGIS